MFTRLFATCTIVVCLTTHLGCTSTIPVSQWKRSLERTVASADRMIIHNSPHLQESDRKPVEIADRKLMADFVNAIEIDEGDTIPNVYCACLGEVQIIFQRGHKKLAWVSFSHANLLKWNKGRWHGDAILTKKSRTAVADWLREHAQVVISPNITVRDP